MVEPSEETLLDDPVAAAEAAGVDGGAEVQEDVVAGEAVEECNPDIEACDADEKMMSTEQPDIMPTVYLGLIHVAKGFFPLLFRFSMASSSIESTSSSLYKTAWFFWWVLNLLVFGILGLLWPLSYSGIAVEFYLFASRDIAIYGGMGLGGLAFLLMLFSAFSESSAWLYTFLILLIDGGGLYGTMLMIDDAEAYYKWEAPVEEKEEKIVEVVEPEEPKPTPEPETDGEETEVDPPVEPPSESEPEPETEPEPEEDNSPFVSFQSLSL